MKKYFIDKIFQIVLQTFEASNRYSTKNTCEKYSSDDHDRYIMSMDEMPEFEDHCMTCTACQQGIYAAAQKRTLEIDLSENNFLFRKTLDIFDELDKRVSKNLFDIVVNITKDVINIIKTTGEILTGPVPLAIRGKGENSSKSKSIKILKELESPAISIQISFLKQEFENDVMMTLSFFNRDSDEFISGVNMVFNDNGKKRTLISDENGEISTLMKAPCDWVVHCKAANEEFAQLNLKSEVY